MNRNNLKLISISYKKLSRKDMKYIKGGSCGCGCCYAGKGGSDTFDNGEANANGGGLHSPGCGNENFLPTVNVSPSK